ncbi:Hypothetical predicted protein, partial [Paramuricea clavata]
TGESSKSANVTEEKKLARQNVWHSVYFFVGYVLLLKLVPKVMSLKSFIKRMMWSGNSPDLNPIERLWDQQKRSVCRRFEEYSTLADLAQLLQEEWKSMSQ